MSQAPVETISPGLLQALLASDTRFALLDVRERGEYCAGHIAGATLLPRGDVEARVARVVVGRNLPVVLYSNAEERSRGVAAVLGTLGYQRISVLQGGLGGWGAAGLPVERGEAQAGKLYAERLAAAAGVPELQVSELLELQARGEPLYVLDVRTPEEYVRGHLPGAWSVPAGQLPLQCEEILGVRRALVVTCCSGRTRALLAAQTLRAMGMPRVYALTHGVLAWAAAGLPLTTGRELPSLPPEVPRPPLVGAAALAGLLVSRRPPTLIDLRPLGRYAAGHIAGAHWVPRGLLEARVPSLVPDRAATIVLCDDSEPQAARAALTLAGLGYVDVCALDAVAMPALGFLPDQELAPRTTWNTGQIVLPEVLGFPEDVMPTEADLAEFVRWRGPAALPAAQLARLMQEQTDLAAEVRAAWETEQAQDGWTRQQSA